MKHVSTLIYVCLYLGYIVWTAGGQLTDMEEQVSSMENTVDSMMADANETNTELNEMSFPIDGLLANITVDNVGKCSKYDTVGNI